MIGDEQPQAMGPVLYMTGSGLMEPIVSGSCFSVDLLAGSWSVSPDSEYQVAGASSESQSRQSICNQRQERLASSDLCSFHVP